jgi:hypothetical protein
MSSPNTISSGYDIYTSLASSFGESLARVEDLAQSSLRVGVPILDPFIPEENVFTSRII